MLFANVTEKKVFVKAFEYYKDTNKALRVVDLYKQNNLVLKSSGVKKQYYVSLKSSLDENKQYFAELVFSNTDIDKDGDKIPYTTLLDSLVGIKADLEHVNNANDNDEVKMMGFDRTWLFEVVNNFFDGRNSIGLVKFNQKHEQFSDVWKNIGDFGASIEYTVENNIPKIKGVSGTFNGRNDGARVINAYVK
jgi:hypothetical protein